MKRSLALWVVVLVAVGLQAFGSGPKSEGRGSGPRLVLKSPLRSVPIESGSDARFVLTGAATEAELGDSATEPVGRGIVLSSAESSGSVAWKVTGLSEKEFGRWYTFRIRALAQEAFHVRKDDLYLRVDFASGGGTRSLDQITKSIFEQVERDRVDLRDQGTNRNLGAGMWRSYAMTFRVPFPEVDTVRLTVGFANGAGGKQRGEFWISEVELISVPAPTDYAAPPNVAGAKRAETPQTAYVVPIGGRWYYDPRGGSRQVPSQFDHTNSDRLLYLTDRLEAPFAGNMSAWLRSGYQDLAGKPVTEDRYVADNVVISFTPTYLVLKSHNLPNHPTAVFPDRWRMLDGNPNYIQEQDFTWYIPLAPKENPQRVAMDATNSNRALPGGAIGVAVNGIILHNPFDEQVKMDAVWRTDRCCGHPSPLQSYHYHKYPVCLNTPWADDGAGHSPLIGFMFDGYPVYGPYESDGEMAQHSKTNPLNEFNVHFDEARGWHYHVTPGKYPHLIGGFWGELEMKNRTRRGPPPGRKPFGGGPPPSRPPQQ